MAPSFLIVGATGNTGRGVVELLSERIKSSGKFSNYRILAQTRSASSPTAKELSKLPYVEIVEYNWTEIDVEWLQEHEVVRAFIASHNLPNQFAEESTFHLAALQAGLEYVVRISTTACNVRPDCEAYYPRAHWAIEALLDSPAYSKLHWTSLQPNVFAGFWLPSAAELIKKVRAGEKQHRLKLIASADAPNAVIDPYDVSTVAAALLLLDDSSKYNKRRLELNGPEDITGEQIVELVEKHIGEKVEDVVFKDISFLDEMIASTSQSKNLIASTKRAMSSVWAGVTTAAATSPEVLELAPPKITPAEVLEKLLC